MTETSRVLLATPFGPVEIIWDEGVLRSIHMGAFWETPAVDVPAIQEGVPPHEDAEQLMEELLGYFGGKPVAFSVFPRMEGYTEFQRHVWRATFEIPYGEVGTYGSVAERIGSPKAARAVGQALGRNPFAIVVPCHRVVGHKGALTGFGAGLGWKRALLRLEGHDYQR